MTLGPILQMVAFAVFAGIAIAGALGMTTTMSMFRSGIFLMASFIGVAGLFILLAADLIGLLQVMMYIGGMLVMILFMVLFMQDPGGAMMAGMMKMSAIETFFSLGLKPQDQDDDEMQDGDNHQMQGDNTHQQMQHGDHKGGSDEMQHGDGKNNDMGDMDMGDMDMSDMSMTTPIKRPAVALAALVGVLLVALLLLRPAWPLATASPDPHSAEQVGMLLMGKYMIGFEGAGLLILVGIFGAVFLARPGAFPDDHTRATRVAVDERPAEAKAMPLPALLANAAPADDEKLDDVVAAHHDEGEH